jgi:hypothetical protein
LSTAPTQMSNPDPLCRRNQLQRGWAMLFHNLRCLFWEPQPQVFRHNCSRGQALVTPQATESLWSRLTTHCWFICFRDTGARDLLTLVSYHRLISVEKKMTVFWVVAPCSLVEITNVSEVFTASIIRVMSHRIELNILKRKTKILTAVQNMLNRIWSHLYSSCSYPESRPVKTAQNSQRSKATSGRGGGGWSPSVALKHTIWWRLLQSIANWNSPTCTGEAKTCISAKKLTCIYLLCICDYSDLLAYLHIKLCMRK